MDLNQIIVGTIGISLYLLVPGIALSFAAFPRKTDLALLDRIGISLLLGVLTPAVQYFNDKNLVLPVNTSTTYATLFGLTFFGVAVWAIRYAIERNKKESLAAAT